MKKLLATLFLFFLVNISFSQQIYKWRASDYSSRLSKDGGESWGSWTEWAKSGVLIVAQDQRVKIYSATPQTYDMIEDVTKDSDKDGNPIYSVMCVDESGVRCKMVWYHTAENGSYVIFEFSNLELMYNVVSLN